MIIQLPNLKNNVKLFLFFLLLLKITVYGQCNTANFTVTTTIGTCLSNSSITVNVPSSANCNGWVAEITKLPNGTPVEQSVPTTGGAVVFSSLSAGSYNVSLKNGFTTIPYESNPVALTTSYVGMTMTFSNVPPTCSSTSPGYTIDGTFTSVITGGIGPFVYKLTTSNGIQTDTSPLRTYTFNNVPGGEQVNIQVTDLVNGNPGCESTILQSPTLLGTTTADLSFDSRQYNFIRDAGNCGSPKMFINLRNLTNERKSIVLQPGNATITIAGATYPLTYVSGQRFTYDPIATGGPNLYNGLSVTTKFNWGCNTLTRTSLVDMRDDYLNVFSSVLLNNTDCSLKYKITVIGDADYDGNRDVYFDQINTVVIEKRISTGPDVWQVVSGADITPDPATLSSGLIVNAPFTSSIPSASNTFFVYQPGFYRVTANDVCHSVTKTINIIESIPINTLNAYTKTSLLSGTVGLEVNTNTYSGLFPLTIQVERLDGQTSIPISSTQPYNYAGNYTIDFPIIKTFNTNPSWFNIMDLPPGDYKVKFTDGCSATTGNIREQTINLTNTAGYNPQYSVIEGCVNSNKINFNLNPNTYTYKPYATQLKSSTGTLLQSVTGVSGVFNNVSSGDYNINFSSYGNGGASYSAALKSFAPFNYSTPLTVAPYNDFIVSTSSILCDINNPNSGIISAQIISGTIVYPITFSLYSVSNPTTPIQGPFNLVSSGNSYLFTGVTVGDYFVRVASPCFISDQNVTVSTVSSIPTAQVSASALCPNSPTTVAIISGANNFYDITWTDNNNVVVGTGTPITLSPSVTTTYTATYSLKSNFGCTNTTTYKSDVTVTVTPDPDLSLAVSDINLCDGTSPSVVISPTQNDFFYEILNSNGSSFSPPLIANGNGGSLTIPIPNTIALVAGQVFKVKARNGNDACSGFLTDVVNILSGTFNVTCPTFPSTSLHCYADIDSQTSYTIAQFQALGKGDGIVDVLGCGVVEITASNGENPGCEGNVTRTYTITEYTDPNNNDIRDSGENTILNQTTCTQTLTIETTDFTMPDNASSTVACTADMVDPTLPAVTDNCGNTLTPSAPVVSTLPTCEGDVTYTYTFTDCKGNTHDWVYTYTIETTDFTMPDNASSTVACIADMVDPTLPAVTDNCGNTLTPSAPVVSTLPTCEGDVTYTYTFTDCKGNTHDWVYKYIIDDNISPTGTAPANLTFQCIADIPVANINEITDEADNCLGSVIVTVADTNNGETGYQGNPYIVSRTYSLTDCAGNVTNLVQTITVQDKIAPTFVGTLPADITVECSAVPTAPVLTAIDNCGTVKVTYDEIRTNGNCANSYSLARSWTATDTFGLETTHIQTIKVKDMTKPVVNQMAGSLDRTLKCSDSQEISNALALVPTATDNCSANPTISLVSDITNAITTCSYSRERKWNFRDECGNVSLDFIQTIIVTDPAPQTVIIADDDTASVIDGFSGIKNVLNILTNDFVDAANATINNVKISVKTPDATGNLILNPDGSVDVKAGTPAGNYTFIYEICTINTPKVCDQAKVTIGVLVPVIIAVNDDYSSKPIDSSKGAVLDVLVNDKINNGTVSSTQVVIAIVDANGIADITVDVEGKIRIPVGTPVGSYEFTYSICDVVNPNNCDTATIFIVIKAPCDFDDSAFPCDILVHNAFSPNNDGINDSFLIDGIENYPENKVEIYNRWGVLVFEVNGYDNTSKVFVGISEGRVTLNKPESLPSGTYYYVVKYKKSKSEVVNQKTGFLYISK